MSGNAQLWVGIVLTILFVIFSIVAISGIKVGADDRATMNGALAGVCLALVWVTDDGGGVYARTFYSANARAAWVADIDLQSELLNGTERTTVKTSCPFKQVWDTWGEANKELWRKQQLKDGFVPYYGDCYRK